ncbi:MAG TPA: glycosyltransferase family A protein [Kouleothrix sp.]|uniref:glycosyltransferase family 2 protein n=1 Tax=Kouleothrix sp. TaxID=2779161 RepID=UPI002C622036|nr:glycosyltransferase family A protein [Kouleothrix sp.]HRC75137.1 glycosyltransferase family A protein [Kouleothrix sp.]
MFISVIIPTLNRPTFIVDAVRSILCGTHQQFEIIVVDQTCDSSTRDALVSLMRDARVRYISTPRPGASAARNLGVAASSADVIVFTDDDVEARPDWLELIAREFSADPKLQFITATLAAPAYDREQGFVPEFRPCPTITSWRLPLAVSNANLSMRRRLFDQIGGYDELCGPGGLLKSSDDGDITLRVVRSGAKWKACPEIEVVHVHGFRPHSAAERLLDDYEYGNGGVYGRALRRGDYLAGGWFLLRELGRLLQAVAGPWRGARPNTRWQLRMRGFWHGFRLPPRDGFPGLSDLRQHAGLILIIGLQFL